MIFVKQYCDTFSYTATEWLNHEIELNKHCWKHEVVGYQLSAGNTTFILVEWVGLTGNNFKELAYEDY